MQKIHFSTFINASPKKVWDTMLSDKTYRTWTAAFNPGSHFEGTWEEGSKILFLGPDPKTGIEGGMVSRIKENRPYEYLSIEHLGIIVEGKEDTTSEEAKKWAPAFENYTFTEKDPPSPEASDGHGAGTELSVDMDIDENEKEVFEEMWPRALKILKELSEE